MPKNLTSILLTPFTYIAIGAGAVIEFFIRFLIWMCLGSYYALNFLVLTPCRFISNSLRDAYYAIFTPKQVKKDKALKLETNFNEKGEEVDTSTKKKDIYSQMKANQKKAASMKKANTVKITKKEKQKLDADRASLLKMISDGQEKRFEKPQTFRYKALNPDGKIETSTFIGVSKLDIYTFLTGEGYKVFSIETNKWINFLYGQSNTIYHKLSTKDLIFFITQLCTYIKAGITLTEAMRILSKQLKKNKNQARITQSIVYYLTMGESFSSALLHQTGAFPQLVINMIKAAEAAGSLEETLEDLGHYYEEINATQKQMISAITYPAIVGIFSIVVIIFIMVKIVPSFVGIYESAGASLNPLTIFIINASGFLKNNLGIIAFLVAVAIGVLVMAYKNIKEFRRQVQVLMMKMPVVGNIIIYNELTIFTKTFASLLKNDVFITDSIEILSKITNNEIYKEIMLNTISNIAKGEKISESFKDQWAVPDVAYYMIVTGENTGMLAEMMSKVSSYYQEQHKVIVNSLKSLIEPALIIFLAVVVGGILIAVILPMFGLYSEIA